MLHAHGHQAKVSRLKDGDIQSAAGVGGSSTGSCAQGDIPDERNGRPYHHNRIASDSAVDIVPAGPAEVFDATDPRSPVARVLSTPPCVARRFCEHLYHPEDTSDIHMQSGGAASGTSGSKGSKCSPVSRPRPVWFDSPTSPLVSGFPGLSGLMKSVPPVALPDTIEAGGSSSSSARRLVEGWENDDSADITSKSKCTARHGALGPPLDFLPTDIDPLELAEFRSGYQRFRTGHAAGARGEIGWLAPLDDADDPASTARPRSNCSERSMEPAADDAAYYSEPEREIVHDVFSPVPPVRDAVDEAPEPPLAMLGRWTPSARDAADAPPSQSPSTRTDEINTRPKVSFMDWLTDEIGSRPDEEQLKRVKQSHLLEVMKAPPRVEKILGFGFLFCLDIMLHELSFTPLQALRALLLKFGGYPLSITSRCDVLRFALLLINVWLISVGFDVSAVYHYIRGESFLKLYVIFNMLEMFERWLRSIGVDLFDLVMASVRDPWWSLLLKVLTTSIYCFVHTIMHLLRVLLLNVAINTSSNAVFLIIVTNNFGEIKSTVFKKYDAKSLFPIITSDMVERFYLVLDIVFVLLRLSISSHRGMYPTSNIASCFALLVMLELITDWVKFCLIIKFSDMKASTLEIYKEVLIADILLCRASHFPLGREGATAGGASEASALPQVSSLRGTISFSHVPARRVGFCGVPLTTLVVVHFAMLVNAPCSAYAAHPHAAAVLFMLAAFVLFLLAKVLLGVILFGCAARRRNTISEGLKLFPILKAL